MKLDDHDALIVVDVQNDFLPGGRLAVAAGDDVIPVLNRYMALFAERGLPVFATRDWHPADHCSFHAQGGPWPPHCVAGSAGADFPAALILPPGTVVISKATDTGADAYSGFEGTRLADLLKERGVQRVFVGGLATDYCVLNTVHDALSLGFRTVLLEDAVRAVNIDARDGEAAIADMRARGARPLTLADAVP